MAEKIVAIIGARLNSSRLPRKQLLPLAGKPLIARLVDRLRRVSGLSEIVLATTADEYNRDLVTWSRDYGVATEAYDGDVNDLVGRVGAVAEKYHADIILYVCGDCPLIEPKTISKAIDALAASQQSEVVELAERADGKSYVHEGFDLYRRSFWDKMESAAVEPFEKEHIGAVYKHTKKVEPQSIAFFEDDDVYADCDHRLSVDTSSDYFFMRRIYNDWYAEHPESSIVDLAATLQKVKLDSQLKAVNAGVRQRRVGEVNSDIALLCEVGRDIGLGHLSRMVVAARSLQDQLSVSLRLYIKGEQVENDQLRLMPHQWVSDFSEVPIDGWDAVVVDVKTIGSAVEKWLTALPGTTARVAVDQSFAKEALFDFMWQPSMFLPPEIEKAYAHKLDYGWHTFLLKPGVNAESKSKAKQDHIIVLTGGGDVAGLGQFLPEKLMKSLPEYVHVDWVQGPYAEPPIVPDGLVSDRFNVLNSPNNLPALLAQYDAAFVVFGVSYFECLLAGIPTVVCDAVNAAQSNEWLALQKEFPSLVADDVDGAVDMLADLMHSGNFNTMNGVQEQLRAGPSNFAALIQSLLASASNKELVSAS